MESVHITQTDGGFGRMTTIPAADSSTTCGVYALTVVTEADMAVVKPGSGVARLYDAKDDSLVTEWDASELEIRPVPESMRGRMPLSDGTMIKLPLEGRPDLTRGGDYYVLADEGLAMAGDTPMPAVEKGDWAFHIEGYGVLEYRYSSGDPETSSVGDTTEIYYLLDDKATSFAVYPETDNTVVSETWSNHSGKCTITFTAPGESVVSMYFLNSRGEALAAIVETMSVEEEQP